MPAKFRSVLERIGNVERIVGPERIDDFEHIDWSERIDGFVPPTEPTCLVDHLGACRPAVLILGATALVVPVIALIDALRG